MRKSRLILKQKRREFIDNFYTEIANRFYQILGGDIPYYYINGAYYYVADPRGMQPDTKLTPDMPIYGEKLFLGKFDNNEESNEAKMSNEMACYNMFIKHPSIDGWKIHYDYDDNYILVTLEYDSDYRVEFEASNTFKIRDCHDGSIKAYDIHLADLEYTMKQAKSVKENCKLDFVNSVQWCVCFGANQRPLPRTIENIQRYNNIYIAHIAFEKGEPNVKYEPIFLYNPSNGKVWRKADYMSDRELAHVLGIIKRGQVLNEQQRKQNQALYQRWDNINNRGFAPNQSKQG